MTRLIVAVILSTAASANAQSTLFSVGPDGPSGLPSSTIFISPPSGDAPIPVAGEGNMGLGPDDVIGSFSRSSPVDSDFLFCFSVTPDTTGGAAPLIDFPRSGISFNVSQQAALFQQAGDAFITTEAFNRETGPVTGPQEATANNVLIINQSLDYPNVFGLLPAKGPAEESDEPDGLDDVRGGASGGLPGAVVTDIYFTLEPGSPSLPSLTGMFPASSANIFFDATPDLDGGTPGDETVYALASDLGLATADVIDGLTVYDDDENGVFSSGDQILFSLTPASPSIATLGVGPADILTASLSGATLELEVFAGAETLGLEPTTANINMIVPVPTFGMSPIQVITRKSLPAGDFTQDGVLDCDDIDLLIQSIALGNNAQQLDLDGDGQLTLADRDIWLAAAGSQNLGPGRSYLLGDANLDGIVDVSDFNLWNVNKFTQSLKWCEANFNADQLVDVSDFNIWNANKFQSARPVPEPSLWIWLLVLVIPMRRLTRIRHCRIVTKAVK
ncbi:MAG: hypothetical protein AAF497_06820 [Planctomycetota bacterium]